MDMRRLQQAAPALLALFLGPPVSVGAESVEVLRGSRLEQVGPGQVGDTTHGVEVIGGSSPESVDFETHRFHDS